MADPDDNDSHKDAAAADLGKQPEKNDQENENGKDYQDTDPKEEETDLAGDVVKGKDEEESRSSSGSDSSDDDDDDSSSDKEDEEPKQNEAKVVIGEDGHVLSAYEIQRLERIQRNKEYLASLGLEKNKQALSAAKAKKKVAPARKKQQDIKRRSSISRASKEKVVTYAERKDKEEAESKKPSGPWKRKKENRAARMERFIHDEFRRIGKEQRNHLKRAQKNVRQADVEFRIAEQTVEKFEKKRRKQIENQQSVERIRQEQRSLGGFTARRMLYEIDMRELEIKNALREFDEQFGVSLSYVLSL